MSNEERVFDEAVRQTDPVERRALVERACAGDDALRRGVEALLAAYEAAADFLESPPPWRNADDLDPIDVLSIVLNRGEEAVGSCIGRYKLIERIGEGAMGCVYVAEQQYPLRRTVALKLVKGGANTSQVVARFEAERQAVALMDHPGIAKVLDAGSTDSGRPYFVMELVCGTPITRFCEGAALGTVERLRLFVQVCRAVQHAHAKGIIHRDLKPTNILVTVVDGQPVPKVIDFGIAKAMEGAAVGRAGLLDVCPARTAGTPMYMSPEQASTKDGADVDTRSDVYGLGALLYELLAGRPPFDERLATGSIVDVRRVLEQEIPPPPSARVGADAGGPMHERGVDRRRLAEDLDWIVARAMHKDRAERYQTVEALAADVERSLADKPVCARPQSLGYVTSKFFRRNRLAAAAVGAVVLALGIGTVGTTAGMVRASRQRDEAVQARTLATQQKDLAEATSQYLQEVIASANPWEVAALGGGSSDVSVRQMLDLAVKRLDERGTLSAQPTAESAVRFSIGLAYLGLGQFQAAHVQLQRATELQRQVTGGRDDHELARRMSTLSVALTALGRPAEAETLALEVLAMRQRLHGTHHHEYAQALDLLASVQRQMGDHSSAVRAARTALDLRRTLPPYPDADEALARSLVELALSLGRQGAEAEAIPLLREAIVIHGRTLAPDHPRLANTLHALGGFLEAIDDGPGACEQYRAALEVRRRHRQEDHDEVASLTRSLIGRLRRDRQYEACEQVLLERRARLGNSISVQLDIEICGQFARLYDAWGRPAETAHWREALRAAFAREERAIIPRDGGLMSARDVASLAQLYVRAGRFEDAARAFGDAVCMDRKRIDVWCTHLLLIAYMDRSQEYRELRRWMHYYFARNPNPNRDILVHLLPPCLALNDAPDQTRLLALADLLTAMSGEQRRLATASILQGIARYRCGDDAAALTALADGRKCELASYRAAGAFFESLAYRRLGQHADAELAFDRGCRLMRDLPEPGLTDLSKHYNPWFLAHIAYREAAAALRATGKLQSMNSRRLKSCSRRRAFACAHPTGV